MIKIRIKEKGGKEQTFTFDKEIINIGRARQNDIVLPRPNISKSHARIMVSNGEIYVIDLKSTNGTYLNGERISIPQKITKNDKIFMGDFLLRVEEFIEEEALIPEEELEAVDEAGIEPPEIPAPPIDIAIEDAAEKASQKVEEGGGVSELKDEFDKKIKAVIEGTEEEPEKTGALDEDIIKELIKKHETKGKIQKEETVEKVSEPAEEPLPKESLDDILKEKLHKEEEEISPPPIEIPEEKKTVSSKEPVKIETMPKQKKEEEPLDEYGGEIEEIEEQISSERITYGELPVLRKTKAGFSLKENKMRRIIQSLISILSSKIDIYKFDFTNEEIKDIEKIVYHYLENEVDSETIKGIIRELTASYPIFNFFDNSDLKKFEMFSHEEIFVYDTKNNVEERAYKISCLSVYEVLIQRILKSSRKMIKKGEYLYEGSITGNDYARVILPPLAKKFPVLTIEKRISDFVPMIHWIEKTVMDDIMAEFIGYKLQKGANFLILGDRKDVRDELLKSFTLFIPIKNKMFLITNKHNPEIPHSNTLMLDASFFRKNPEEVSTVLAENPFYVILEDTLYSDFIMWLMKCGDNKTNLIASVTATDFNDFLSRVKLTFKLQGYNFNLPTIGQIIASGVNYVVEVFEYPCGTLKIKNILEISFKDNELTKKPVFVFKEDRKSPDGKIVGHFEKGK